MIKLDIFSDSEKLQAEVFEWLDEFHDNHPLSGKNIHLGLISGSCQQHYAGFITRQSLYQFDAPRDLIVYKDDIQMELQEFLDGLNKKIMEKGSFYLSHSDCSFYIPEEEISRLTNPERIQEKTSNPYSLAVALRAKYD